MGVTNTPGTAKVLGSNVTWTCFFFSNGKYSVPKKLSVYNLPADVFSA